MTLRDALLSANVAGAEHLDEALARQQLYGSDLITNLSELVVVREAETLHALAEHFRLQAAAPGELPYATGPALEMIPRDLAKEHSVYPFRLEGNVLTVIVAGSLPADAGALLGLPGHIQLQPLLALAPRVRQAIARDYAFGLERRTAKAVDRLTYAGVSEPTEPPPRATHVRSFSQLPRPPSTPPFGFPDQWSDSLTPSGSALLAETAQQPTVAAGRLQDDSAPPGPARDLLLGGSLSSSGPPRSRRRGPYTLTQLNTDLEQRRSSAEVLEVYFKFASQFFDYAALITVQANRARVRDTQGSGAPAHEAGANRLAIDDYPALSAVCADGRWQLFSLPADDPALADLLARESARRSVLLPLKVKGRVVLVLFGAFDHTAVTLETLGDLVAAETFVSQALERVIRLRKAPAQPLGQVLGNSLRPRHPSLLPTERVQRLANLIQEAKLKE